MKREIKFKLWNPEKKVLTGGNYLNTILATTDNDFVNDFDKKGMVWLQFTGLKDEKGREIYDGDVYFNEIEQEDGDVRLYYICKWINEWGRFVWLHLPGELMDYEDNGVENFVEYEFDFDAKRMHYAGNIHETPERLEAGPNYMVILKPNYKSKDGHIKPGIFLEGKYYAPKSDLPN